MKFTGRMVASPEVRFDPQGDIHVMFDVRVTKVIVACEFTGEPAHDFAWEIHPYNLAGFRVAVSGAMTSARWRDHDGRQRVRTYFRVDELACRLPERNVPVRFGGTE